MSITFFNKHRRDRGAREHQPAAPLPAKETVNDYEMEPATENMVDESKAKATKENKRIPGDG